MAEQSYLSFLMFNKPYTLKENRAQLKCLSYMFKKNLVQLNVFKLLSPIYNHNSIPLLS